MIASALQTPYTNEDFQLYKEWTQGKDVRKIAFSNALYRFRTGGHIQAVVSGEYNHGKSTTAMLLTKWDTIYTRQLLEHYKDPRYERAIPNLKWSIKESTVISPKDPSSKYIMHPQFMRPYEIDEGYLFATTQEATEKKTTQLRDAMAQNRKLSPSMYWVYPNIFKMPSIMMENMMEIIHKSSMGHGIMIAPSTVIQIKEKFDKQKIEKYAKKPKYFMRSMRWHSGFIFYPNFPKMKGAAWDKYLKKYDKYKINVEEEKKKTEGQRSQFYMQIDKLIDKNIIHVESKADIEKFIRDQLIKESGGKHISDNLPNLLASEYTEWKLEKTSGGLLKRLAEMNLRMKIDIDDLTGG